MHSLISIAAVIAISLHSVLGCCWHRAPMADANAVTLGESSHQSTKRVGCGCRAIDDSNESTRHSQLPSDDSQEPCREKCDYSVVSRVDHDEVQPASYLGGLAIVGSSWFEFDGMTPVSSTVESDIAAPRVRLHLRYCRLVI